MIFKTRTPVWETASATWGISPSQPDLKSKKMSALVVNLATLGFLLSSLLLPSPLPIAFPLAPSPYMCYNTYHMDDTTHLDNKEIAFVSKRITPNAYLNNFDHRGATPPTIHDPDNLVTKPTPAQRERLIYLVDDALDTLEDAMAPGNRMSDRLAAANSTLDRAGLNSKGGSYGENQVAPILAEALVQVIAGLAQVFGQKAKIDPKDVTPPSEVLTPVHPDPPSKPSPPKNPNGGLPATLLNQYSGDDQ